MQGYRVPCAFGLVYACSGPFVLERLCLVCGSDSVTNALASKVEDMYCYRL